MYHIKLATFFTKERFSRAEVGISYSQHWPPIQPFIYQIGISYSSRYHQIQPFIYQTGISYSSWYHQYSPLSIRLVSHIAHDTTNTALYLSEIGISYSSRYHQYSPLSIRLISHIAHDTTNTALYRPEIGISYCYCIHTNTAFYAGFTLRLSIAWQQFYISFYVTVNRGSGIKQSGRKTVPLWPDSPSHHSPCLPPCHRHNIAYRVPSLF